MRKITREIVALLAVFVIYFGYSSWYTNQSGELPAVAQALLQPFQLVLVGGVFGLLVPLTKSIFFGTIDGTKSYIKARRSNVLFNYQAAIAFVSGLKATLETGDYEQIKAKYAAYSGLAFKPKFLDIMMDEIGDSLIKEQDMSIYIKPSDVVLNSIKQMYEKERKLAITGKPTEMGFDFKRGYEYTSMGSKYVIAYFKSLDTKADTKAKMGWKVFSLEMFKFMIAMIFAIIPMVIVSVIVIPSVSTQISDKAISGYVSVAVIFGSWMVFGVIFHAIMVFTNSQYRVMWKSLIAPAITYYIALIFLAGTFVLGLAQLINGMDGKWGQTGPIAKATDKGDLWAFFSLLTSLVLSTTLMMYVVSTLMDGFTSPRGMTTKLLVDGVVLPLIAWAAAIVLSTMSAFGGNTFSGSTKTTFASVSFGVTIAFWIYLSVSSLVMNNIAFPSRKQKMALKAELANEGVKDTEKQAKAEQARKDK